MHQWELGRHRYAEFFWRTSWGWVGHGSTALEENGFNKRFLCREAESALHGRPLYDLNRFLTTEIDIDDAFFWVHPRLIDKAPSPRAI